VPWIAGFSAEFVDECVTTGGVLRANTTLQPKGQEESSLRPRLDQHHSWLSSWALRCHSERSEESCSAAQGELREGLRSGPSGRTPRGRRLRLFRRRARLGDMLREVIWGLGRARFFAALRMTVVGVGRTWRLAVKDFGERVSEVRAVWVPPRFLPIMNGAWIF